MEGLRYHPVAIWWRDLIGHGVWTDLLSLLPVLIVIGIGLAILPKVVGTIFKLVVIISMLLVVAGVIIIFNPFGAADIVLGFLN